MSYDEDFSVVMETPQSEETLEGIQNLIINYKKQYDQLLDDQKHLTSSRNDQQDMAKKFKERTEKLIQDLEEDQHSYAAQLENEQVKLSILHQEEAELMMELQNVMAALKEEESLNDHLKQQTDVFTAVPERKVVFKGHTRPKDAQTFQMKPHIVYPMEGGTALITFEEDAVARKILSMKTHMVVLSEDVRIKVEARPVPLMLPRLVEIDTEVCPHRILISNLPQIDPDILLNKLEIHFSKTKHGGGEVDSCEMLPDSRNVVLTFVQNNFSRGLTEVEHHDVQFQDKKHRVRVTPFLNGKITNLEFKVTLCPRTVLLTGIPDIMEQETLQDLLEIHFQKNTNGGGETEAFLYNPLGQNVSALFEGVSPESEKKV